MKKTVLITGGAKGIGRALSEKLASEGWNLALCGRDLPALEQSATEIRKKHAIEIQVFAADLSKPHAAREIFERWEPGNLPQALICNAGSYGTLGPLAEVNFESWKKSFDLNFFSVAEQIQLYTRRVEHASRSLRHKIIVMSGSGLGGSKVWPGISAYGCAKAALYRLVETVHEEVHTAYGIDINCIAPGAVKTGITDQAAQAGKKALGNLYDATLKVLNEGGDSPDFAANAVATLLSDACDGLSGRLISAKWDGKFLNDRGLRDQVNQDPDLLRLRRIDNELFSRKSR